MKMTTPAALERFYRPKYQKKNRALQTILQGDTTVLLVIEVLLSGTVLVMCLRPMAAFIRFQ